MVAWKKIAFSLAFALVAAYIVDMSSGATSDSQTTNNEGEMDKITYHRDHTVTLWNVYSQEWIRTGVPSDRILASLNPRERDRVIRHCGI